MPNQLGLMKGAVAATTPLPAHGMLYSGGRTGVIARPVPPFQQRRPLLSPRDWKITEASRDASNIYLSVYPSTVNQVIATNWNSTHSVGLTGTWYVKLTCSVSSGQVSSTSISTGTGAASAIGVTVGAPPTSFQILLGIVVDGVILRVAQAKPFVASVVEVYRAAKVTTTPGEYPLDIYWTWQLTQP